MALGVYRRIPPRYYRRARSRVYIPGLATGTIVPQNASWTFLADNTTITQLHIIATVDASWTFVADAGRVEPIIPVDDASWTFIADNTTLLQNYVLVGQDAAWTFVADAGRVEPILQPADAAWTFLADATSLLTFVKPQTAYGDPTKPKTAYTADDARVGTLFGIPVKQPAAYAATAKPTTAYGTPTKPPTAYA